VVKSDTGHFRIVSEAYSLQAAAQQLNLEIADHTWTPIANFTALMGSNGIVLTDTSTILNAPVDTLYIRVSMQPGACGAYRLWFTTVSTVGIAEAEQAPLLEVFPNPTDGHVRISWPEVGEGTLELHDATGRVVLQRNVRADARSIELDLSGLSLGTYACMVRNTDTRHWARILRE
jgi:hypothetical protein